MSKSHGIRMENNKLLDILQRKSWFETLMKTATANGWFGDFLTKLKHSASLKS